MRSRHWEDPLCEAAPEMCVYQNQERRWLWWCIQGSYQCRQCWVYWESVGTMLLRKVDIIFGHKASKPGSPPAKQCQKLPRVLNASLFCLYQLVLLVDYLRIMTDTSVFWWNAIVGLKESEERDSLLRLKAMVSKDSLPSQPACRFCKLSYFLL